MHKRISRAFVSVRERARVSYANIVTIGGFCDVDLTVVKATSPGDSPLPDKYVLELLKIFSISSSSYRAFTLSFIRRFRRTKSWRVAVKCLLLLHRLIRSLPDDSPLRDELSWARTSGLLSLYPCNFRDHSSSFYEDYTTFTRSYARLLDEILDYTHIETSEEKRLDTISIFSNLVEEQVSGEGSSPEIVLDECDSPRKPKDLGIMVELLPQLQSLIDRSIECTPIGKASRNYLVQSVLKLIIRDTFTFYTTFRNEIVTVLDNLIQLPNHSRVAAFSIYKKAAIQADHLLKFHDQSKSIGHFESHEYPFIDQIPLIQVQALENFLSGMCHLSNDHSSSSNMSTITFDEQSVTSPRDEDSGNEVVQPTTEHNQVVKYVEMEPLIKWDDDEVTTTNLGWEDILEASISTNAGFKWSNGNLLGGTNGWEIQQYNGTYAFQTQNPFYPLPQNTYCNYHSCPNTPMRSLIDL